MSTFAKIKSFLFENKSIRQTVAKNTFWMAASQFIGRLLRALVVIYAARVLGAESWGAFSYALGIAAFLTIFSDVGIAALITREASRNPEMRQKYLSTAFAIKTGLLTAGIAVFLVISRYLSSNPEVLGLFPIIVFLTALDSFRDLSTSIARAAEKIEIEARVNIFTNLAIVVIGFIALAIVPSSRSLAIAYVIGSGLGFLAIAFSLRQYFSGLFKNFSASLIKPILVSAWPFGLMALMGAIMINTDLIMIGIMRSIREVGFYSAAQRPIQLLYILPGLFAVPLFPVMSRLANDRERFARVFEKAMGYVFLLALPLAVGGFILGKEIVALLFGAEYLPAAETFKVLMITMLTTFPSAILGNAIFALNREKKLIAYTVIGVMGNLALDLILIPRYGIIGSAWATVITQIISNSYVWIKMGSFVKKPLILRVFRIAIAAAFMGLVIIVMRLADFSAIPILVVASLAYIGGLIALKDPTLKELPGILG